MSLVFVPVSRRRLADLAGGETWQDVDAFAPDPGVVEASGPDAGEELERAALVFASVAALLDGGVRIVLVADVAATTPDGTGFGEVVVPTLTWRQVTAVFADDPGAADAVAAALGAVAGHDLDAAWETDQVATLIAEHDLLWFGPGEVAALI